MNSLPKIRECIASYSPVLINDDRCQKAAVSIILAKDHSAPQVLFIERAVRTDDPWSGQMAFPGGKQEQNDEDKFAAAVRETREEVGLKLHADSCIGRLDDLTSPVNSPDFSLVIAAYVFELSAVPPLRANNEVSSVVWIPIERLVNPEYFIADYQPVSYPGRFPAIRVAANDSRVIWGLTYRFVTKLFNIIEMR